jgi:hypothetical protein
MLARTKKMVKVNLSRHFDSEATEELGTTLDDNC